MADIMGRESLARYQWKQHGRCAALPVSAYFGPARRAYGALDLPRPEAGRAAAAAVEAAPSPPTRRWAPDGVIVTCREGRTEEVRVCLNPRARTARLRGGRPRRRLPPARSATDAARPVTASLSRLHRRAGYLAVRLADAFRPRLNLGCGWRLFDAAGRIFLVRHSYIPGLHLPGGAVDAGETCRESAVREAREEGGLVLDAAPELFHIYHTHHGGPRSHVVLFVARGARQARPPAPGSRSSPRGSTPSPPCPRLHPGDAEPDRRGAGGPAGRRRLVGRHYTNWLTEHAGRC